MEPSHPFYLTTTLPYVNSVPHMGHTFEFVLADVLARYQREQGRNVFFNTGTDEHGLKIYRKAQEEGIDIQTFTDRNAAVFKDLLVRLNIHPTEFIRTTDPKHIHAAQEFWKRCDANGDIYKKTYQTKYCVGCELEKTDSELVDGTCPLHPSLEIELVDEENYFFRWSKYQQQLLDLYHTQPNFVVPESRLTEITRFVEGGLEDFSISRLHEKMPWGIPVPGDEKHVMYVWFDALTNYVSTLGWPEKTDVFDRYWGTKEHPNAIQIAGKDNLRQQSAMWQAMLLSAGLPTSKQIIIHGFILSNGVKMSKTAGNVIDPYEALEMHGTDALRYFLIREVSTFEDGDFTWERFAQAYQAGLANGIGNLVSRTLKMAVMNDVLADPGAEPAFVMADSARMYHDAFANGNIKRAADVIWEAVAETNKYIEVTEPFKTIKTDPEKAKRDIQRLMKSVEDINVLLRPFLPETSEKIADALAHPSVDAIPRLFPRLADPA